MMRDLGAIDRSIVAEVDFNGEVDEFVVVWMDIKGDGEREK